ncbi:UNVERIFIED_CONTAM: hypothetical protein K2H54_052590 [Gekko kuhli]
MEQQIALQRIKHRRVAAYLAAVGAEAFAEDHDPVRANHSLHLELQRVPVRDPDLAWGRHDRPLPKRSRSKYSRYYGSSGDEGSAKAVNWRMRKRG